MLDLLKMIQETWKLFPRLIEQKINRLLDESEPNNAKAYQLYMSCKNENLWKNSFELFSVHLSDYFSLHKSERVKSYFDQFLDRPMNRSIFDAFQLTFRTAQVNSESVSETAQWSYNLMKFNCKINSEVISLEILTKTLEYITSPPLFEKDHDIEFEDFCIAWKKIIFTVFGNALDPDMELILKEVRWLNKLLKKPELLSENITYSTDIYLTQTEIDWTSAIQNEVFEYKTASKFPLSRGPDKDLLQNLLKTVTLYNIILSSTLYDLIQHQENVRFTILNQCSNLLKKESNRI